MKKLLNTLYITSENSYLSLDGENIVIKREDGESSRLPIHNFQSVISFGRTGASPALMQACAQRGVALCFLSPGGEFLARVSGERQGNVLLRRAQYRIADDGNKSVRIAANFIIGKLYNSRVVLERALRDHAMQVDGEKLRRAAEDLRQSAQSVSFCAGADELRGVEGRAATLYFDAMDEMILQQKNDFFMASRSRRPPLDNLNALLSFLYTLLTHDCTAALEAVGLDPYVGFFHTDRPGRASLALDLMEELRPVFADRLALSLINRRQVLAKGFTRRESGGIRMDDETRKAVLVAWQERKRDEITHPYLNEKIPFGLIPHVQALLLSRNLRGDIDGYPPFFYR